MFINKRILIALGILVILILGGLGFTTALLLTRSNASASNIASTPALPTITATSGLSAGNVCPAGVISSINAQGQTFVVTEKGARTITVTTDSQTTYRKRGATGLTFSSLSVGQRERVTSRGACDATTSSVTARAITIVVAASVTPTPTP